MLRIRFTAEDLLQVTIAPRPAPLMEMVLALATSRRKDLPAFYGRWQRHARQSLPRGAYPLGELVAATGRGPMFLDPVTHVLEEGVDLVRGASAEFVRTELQRVCTRRAPSLWARGLADQDHDAWSVLNESIGAAYGSLLEPHWNRIRSGFDAERAWRVRQMADHGIRQALSSLGPGAHWQGTTVSFPAPYDWEVTLNGQGLLLLPSLFWHGWPLIAEPPDAPRVLVYPATTPLPLLDKHLTTDPLAALLGRTRAATLAALAQPRTTSELAQELHISQSSASEHAKALRNAQLVTTARDGKAVRHSCTPLGLDLLTPARALG
ncbi:helix-turn-helix domain-containing protein [Streptomyces formicae]|uniref:Regulatory protein n=1 Tax=Streptomyces formicae TaxID=1616117 RepID=A0A291Q2S4_9ACTN|nr:helix-turn-helix domain-containing protein [Streptomyces formicae]ATL26019.1 Putative regulatory protein [Streptomyces formicae]